MHVVTLVGLKLTLSRTVIFSSGAIIGRPCPDAVNGVVATVLRRSSDSFRPIGCLGVYVALRVDSVNTKRPPVIVELTVSSAACCTCVDGPISSLTGVVERVGFVTVKS